MEDLLKIYSYSDSERKSKLGVFQCKVSPTAFKMEQNNLYGNLYAINGRIPLSAFSSGGKNSTEVTLVLDGTGAYASKNKEPISVVTQLIDLMKNTTDYIGSIHQPPFLKLVWGNLPVVLCRAEKLDVAYKTFNSKGVPVRADVRLIFVQDADVELSERQANKESPDLFHEHLVLNNETLASISYQYYDSTNHLYLIASTNNLDNLYDCEPGTTLLIPPLNTEERFE
ncbi:MAG: hypothetical protein JKY48_00740 [Flavobacteriales bacterium]|nr:hypothetical protein [Flavobacteriales bacterium]